MYERILLDVDDVLLNYERGFLEYNGVDYESIDHGQHQSFEDIFGSTHDVNELIVAFNASEQFKYIPATVGSHTFIDKAKALGYKIDIITSCGDNSITRNNRIDNLQREFGDVFEETIILPLYGSKEAALKKYNRSLWIDDNLKNVCSGTIAGHHSLLFGSKLNHHHNVLNRINTWTEAFSVLNSHSLCANI